MIKLYRRNELLFAIVCIVVYVVTCGSLRNLGDDSPAMTAGLAVLCALLAAFVARNGLADKYGLSRWPTNSRQMLYLVPLWVVSTGNLWCGIHVHYQGIGLACAIASFALVGFVEELIFRGFLFRAMQAGGSTRAAIVVSSVTFGMGHIVNLLTGQPSLHTFVQMVYAVAVGFIFMLTYYKSGSLLPAIVAHGAIDVLSVFSARSELADWVYICTTIVVAVAYCLYLSRLETPESTRPDAQTRA